MTKVRMKINSIIKNKLKVNVKLKSEITTKIIKSKNMELEKVTKQSLFFANISSKKINYRAFYKKDSYNIKIINSRNEKKIKEYEITNVFIKNNINKIINVMKVHLYNYNNLYGTSIDKNLDVIFKIIKLNERQLNDFDFLMGSKCEVFINKETVGELRYL